MPAVELTRWPHDTPPTRSQLDADAILRQDKLSPSWWSNGPGDRYAAHSHAYNKILFCAEGSVTFRTEPLARHLTLGCRWSHGRDVRGGTSEVIRRESSTVYWDNSTCFPYSPSSAGPRSSSAR